MSNKKQQQSISDKISEYYYTAQQAQKRLGITKDSFNYYVKKGAIRKVNLIGKQSHYPKNEIDALAMSVIAAIIAAQQPAISFKKASLEEVEREYELSVLNYGEKAKRFHDQRRELLTINPDVTYYEFDHDTLVASVNIVPLNEEGMKRFQAGESAWNLGAYIEPYAPGKALDVCIIDFMTTPLVPSPRRTQYAMHLFMGLARVLDEFAEKGIVIERLWTFASSVQGRHLAATAGFEKVAEFGQRHLYKLDIAGSELKILSSYQDRIAKLEKRYNGEHK